MNLTLLCTLPSDHTRARTWVLDGLESLGHDVRLVDRPDLPVTRASTLGYAVVDSWHGTAPGAVLALGWVAGVAAHLATRELPAPVLLRLPRPGRSGDPAVTRVERALVRGGANVLASSPAEAEELAGLGAPRGRLRVLPEAVDVARLARRTDPAHADGDIVVATDDSAPAVTAVLEGMAVGRPAVVLRRGVLPDLVVDGVTGLVVPPRADLSAAVRALRTDPLRLESMGMAAADRAAACFDVTVVVAALGRLLDELQVSTLATV